MMQRLFLIILLILTISISAQMQKFPLLEPINNTIPESFIVDGGENELLMFWIDSTDLHMSKSLDNGTTWGAPKTLVDNTSLLDSLSDLNVLKLNSGRILVTYKFKFHYAIHSNDNGLNWTLPIQLITEMGIIRPRQIMESSLSQTNDNKIWFVYNRLNIIYNIKSDDGITWSKRDTIAILEDGPHFSSVNSHWNNSLVLTYQLDDVDASVIYQSVSIDSGKTWSEPNLVLDSGTAKTHPRVTKDSDGSLWLTYVQKETTPFENYFQSNIYYSKLINGEINWGSPIKFTNYAGFDGTQNLSIVNNKAYITFVSSRVGLGNELWYGIADETNDTDAPPVIFETEVIYQNDYPKVNISITAKVFDSDEIDSVLFHYKDSNEIINVLQLFDDGFHNDGEAEDFVFGNDVLGLGSGFTIDKFYSAVDLNGNSTTTRTANIKSPFNADGGETFLFDNNSIKLPINSRGVLADVEVGSESAGAKFDDSRFIYSAGFTLSGYTNGELWGNGVMTGSSVNDYLAGTIANPQISSGIYIVRSSQPDFYQSWINWCEAVKAGADFYDGDGDGLYNPVDKNENGQWDLDEDRPSIIGDITAFTVFNDGIEPQYRTFVDVEPQGIEIKQTVFSYDKTTLPKLSNVIFVRYKIENIGTIADKMDSVYFGAWADMDVGDYRDDLIGTDTLLNATYGYNDGRDEDYGINSPACFISFIQAPPVYIEGDTYEDANGNGVYDEGIDAPLDRAYNRKGDLLGVDEYPGAKNNGLTANIHYVSGHPTQGDPNSEIQLRSYMLGHNEQGELIDPCNWWFGEVFNEDCSVINPRFMYSGDPVKQVGWVNTDPSDQRQLSSTGPFNLVKGEPIEIIVAYIVGRGTDALNSITEARRNTQNAIDFYYTNFSYIPVGVNDKLKTQLPREYSLYQNYPNPFNPSTTIRYSIPKSTVIASGAKQSNKITTSSDEVWTPRKDNITLKIYDILGREVTTLVNKQQKAGNYEVQFDASNLTSGVYLYQIHSGNFIESKKMILLR
jgi:Secretion system C-terminal sorting domain